jgi:hypothetical protein
MITDTAIPAAAIPDAATVSSWPALVAYALGLIALGVGQWRQHRATREVKHQVTNNNGGSLKDGTDRIENVSARIESKLDTYIADEPSRRWRARREAAGFAAMAALVSVAVTLSKTRR